MKSFEDSIKLLTCSKPANKNYEKGWFDKDGLPIPVTSLVKNKLYHSKS